MTTTPRLDTVSGADERALLEQLLGLAPRGLALAHDASTGRFAQTVRAVAEPTGVRVRPEGTNLRYAAMAASVSTGCPPSRPSRCSAASPSTTCWPSPSRTP